MNTTFETLSLIIDQARQRDRMRNQELLAPQSVAVELARKDGRTVVVHVDRNKTKLFFCPQERPRGRYDICHLTNEDRGEQVKLRIIWKDNAVDRIELIGIKPLKNALDNTRASTRLAFVGDS